MRLFVALPLPDETKGALVDLQGRLRQSKTPMKLVEPQNMHMTLRFIGPGNPQEWIAKLDRIAEKPFNLLLDRVGAFPDATRPRVVWAGGDAPESLLKIHGIIASQGLAPHVTLARVKGKPDNALAALIGTAIGVPVRVDRVRLMDSTLGPLGPKYEVVYEKAL